MDLFVLASITLVNESIGELDISRVSYELGEYDSRVRDGVWVCA